MKIDNTHAHGPARNVSRERQPAAETSFKSQFKQALQDSSPGRIPSAAITATRSPAAVPPLGTSTAHMALQTFEDFLSSLESYQKRLGDGRFNLKMLAQDLNQIGAYCRQLEPLTRDPRIDEGLYSLLKEGLATARAEMERFHRGDYC